MDPTAPRNVAVTTEASATDSPGSVAVLRDTRGTGEWCEPGREGVVRGRLGTASARLTPPGAQVPRGVPRGPLRAGLR